MTGWIEIEGCRFDVPARLFSEDPWLGARVPERRSGWQIVTCLEGDVTLLQIVAQGSSRGKRLEMDAGT